MEEREAALVLVCTPGLGPGTAAELLKRFGSYAAVVAAAVGPVRCSGALPRELRERVAGTVASGRHLVELRTARRTGARFAAPGDPDYPDVLAEIARPPIGIFVKGAPLGSLQPAVAIVGTRSPTPRGVAFARALASDIARVGIPVVSGLARGIDTAAHRGALDAGGRTVAVLGSGIAEPYPPENVGLARGIASSGAVVSEFLPTQEPRPASFPQRNRIISGLSMGVVVVEAGARSGALITAARALEQGREVFAVPGPVDEPQSRGPNGLIKRGARLVEGIEDVLDELERAWGPFGGAAISAARPGPRAGQQGGQDEPPGRGGPAGRVAGVLSMTPLSADEIAARLGERVERVLSCLLSLEIEGLAAAVPGGRYVRGRRG